MKKKGNFDAVYQFKVTLQNVKPPVWRRVQVPETYTFWDLHVAIQNAMGWTDSHLHEFEVKDHGTGAKLKIGIPDEDFENDMIPGWKPKISDFFSEKNSKAFYIYDFGDFWEHLIELEKILDREKDTEYPRCTRGKRACPPEDCGGPGGYAEFLRAISNPRHREHKEMLEWIGGKFNPEHFDAKEVKFIDPEKYRKNVFGR